MSFYDLYQGNVTRAACNLKSLLYKRLAGRCNICCWPDDIQLQTIYIYRWPIFKQNQGVKDLEIMLYFACSITTKLVKLMSLLTYPFDRVWVNPKAIICPVQFQSIRFAGAGCSYIPSVPASSQDMIFSTHAITCRFRMLWSQSAIWQQRDIAKRTQCAVIRSDGMVWCGYHIPWHSMHAYYIY